MHVEEIQLQVKYGTIAGKWWGSREKRPILCVHGWQDNAGVFDTLIPLLPPQFSYLAIDLPGHGRSSRYANGYYYHASDVLHLLEEIRKQFEWERISLISHSMGAIVSFLYAALYPDCIDLVCAIDTLKPQVLHPKLTAKIVMSRWGQSMSATLSSLDHTQRPPEYTYDELIERVHYGSFQSVDKDKAKYLIDRGTAKTSDTNKFYFTRDIRVKYMHPYVLQQEVSLACIKRIKAAFLFIKGNDEVFSEPNETIQEAVETFQKYNKNFEMLRVEGTHHFHLNHPELIAGSISKLLATHHAVEPNKHKLDQIVSKL